MNRKIWLNITAKFFAPPPMPFEINSKHVYLTYPHFDFPIKDAYQHLLTKYMPDKLLVAHEFHADGTDHIHCYMVLPKALRSKDCHIYDMFNRHGNYQGCRSPKNVLKYCTKDSDYLANFDVNTMLANIKPDRRVIASELLKKRPLTDVVAEYPQLLFGYNRLKVDLATYFSDLSNEKDPLYHWLPNPWGLLLSSRLLTKKRHYWIYSDKPNLGKTYLFARPLAQSTNTVIRTGNEPYWSGLRPDTQCVILDEFNVALFKFFELNSMADGTFSYRVFMLGVLILNNPLIVILSNSSLATIYPNRNDLLFARFNEIKLD